MSLLLRPRPVSLSTQINFVGLSNLVEKFDFVKISSKFQMSLIGFFAVVRNLNLNGLIGDSYSQKMVVLRWNFIQSVLRSSSFKL